MGLVLIDEQSLIDIAPQIRAKLGVDTLYRAQDMAAAIAAIETGGGSGGSANILIDSQSKEYKLSDCLGASRWTSSGATSFTWGNTSDTFTFDIPDLTAFDYRMIVSTLISPMYGNATMPYVVQACCMTLVDISRKQDTSAKTAVSQSLNMAITHLLSPLIYFTSSTTGERVTASISGGFTTADPSVIIQGSVSNPTVKVGTPQIVMATNSTLLSATAAKSTVPGSSNVRVKVDLYQLGPVGILRTAYSDAQNRILTGI